MHLGHYEKRTSVSHEESFHDVILYMERQPLQDVLIAYFTVSTCVHVGSVFPCDLHLMAIIPPNYSICDYQW